VYDFPDVWTKMKARNMSSLSSTFIRKYFDTFEIFDSPKSYTLKYHYIKCVQSLLNPRVTLNFILEQNTSKSFILDPYIYYLYCK